MSKLQVAGLEKRYGGIAALDGCSFDIPGPGIYGFEAASLEYYGVRTMELTQKQAIELAASLPSPRKDNPRTRTERFEARVQKITRWLTKLNEIEAEPAPLPEQILLETTAMAAALGTSE